MAVDYGRTKKTIKRYKRDLAELEKDYQSVFNIRLIEKKQISVKLAELKKEKESLILQSDAMVEELTDVLEDRKLQMKGMKKHIMNLEMLLPEEEQEAPTPPSKPIDFSMPKSKEEYG